MTKDIDTGFLTVFSDYEVLNIPFETIMYLQSKRFFVIVHTSKEKIISNTGMRQMKSNLPDRLFIQAHNDYVVAISQIDAIEPSRLTLINGEKVPLGKKFKQPLIDVLISIGMIEKGF